VVALNRRLPAELARAGGAEWAVTTVAPRFFHGDLRDIPLEPAGPGEAALASVGAHLTRHPHVFFYGRELSRLLKQDWDVVHCWEEPYVAAGAQVALATSPTARLVFASYQNIPKTYPPPFRQMERFVLRRCAGWVAGGTTIRDALAQRPGYRDRPCAQISMGVDVEAFRPDPAAGAAALASLEWSREGPPVVGFLGRFVPEKGCAVLMRALDQARHPWRALFVGNGPMEGELRRWAEGHGGDRARIHPGVPHDQVPAFLNAMDVLCAPSQTTRRWKEQFGRMLVEAFACGRAVIASDSGEIPHTVGDAAAVVPEADVAAWAAALDALLADPARRAELGARGLQRARARFAWPVVARQYLDFFERLLS
jgi:glycosyltransferase involved in cell wall biosynthesis